MSARSRFVPDFLGRPSERFLKRVRYIGIYQGEAANPDVIHHSFERGWITKWERDFYLDTWDKPLCQLTPRQQAKRLEINDKIVEQSENLF